MCEKCVSEAFMFESMLQQVSRSEA